MWRLFNQETLRQAIVVGFIPIHIGSTFRLHAQIPAEKILLSVDINGAPVGVLLRRCDHMHH